MTKSKIEGLIVLSDTSTSRTLAGGGVSKPDLPRSVRVVLWGLTVAVLGLTAMVVVLFAARTSEAVQQQRQINSTFCMVLAQLPQDSPELARIRGQLGCTQPGLSPYEMKQLAKTGGTH